ncbi:PhzF family phenazine biosynthesis protein [Agarilytica rhodophyticola]|uniref:PhzF family phenazine biosynthesis protein n=1 Tax=Agarilytica rhodophyticola TaxID=1737490 RepID=UPI000B3468E0|nr:PhzF family phenazine biosynthesis protein [Agarilytica rhodophyticola]
MKVEAIIVNAFTHSGEGGNPAGIVLQADHLNHDQKLSIARTVGLSETAFVSSSSNASYKLDFYTPTRQIAHCGHATVATFSYLSQIGSLEEGWSSKETIEGNRRILIKEGRAYMEQSAPKYYDIDDKQISILDSLGVNKQHIMFAPKLINTGNSFVVLGLNSQADLANITPNFDKIHTISETLDLVGYYVFSTETFNNHSDATARMFAPRYGIQEESATGMAAGPLACYLHSSQTECQKLQFSIEQGYLMDKPSPSIIYVDVEANSNGIISLLAGGNAKLNRKVTIEV